MTQKVLSFDLGGTKLAAAVVTSQGRVIAQTRVPAAFSEGKAAVVQQMVDLGNRFLKQFQDINRIGVASAGPLNPVEGILLDPTNFVSKHGRWGNVPFSSLLEKKFKKRVFLENDAAAAILAEHWVGAARNYPNAMILTLGTGLGTGVICNGHLIRVGEHLHTEGGHMVIGHGDPTALCGCGNYGCAEAYLSGKNFSLRVAKKLNSKNLKGDEITSLARRGNQVVLDSFNEYADWMAVAIYNFCRIFNPQIFIFTGGFAEASDLFLPRTKIRLKKLLNAAPKQKTTHPIPKLVVSTLHNEAGLIGAAYRAIHCL